LDYYPWTWRSGAASTTSAASTVLSYQFVICRTFLPAIAPCTLQPKRRIQRTFDTHKEAVEFHKDVQAQVVGREYVRPSLMTIGAVAETWHKKKAGIGVDDNDQKRNYRRASLVDWKNHIDNYIVPKLGNLKVHDLDVEQIERAAAQWGTRVSPKMVNKVLTTLTAILAMAKRYKNIKDNPAKDAERLKVATEDEGDEVTPDKVYTKEALGKLIRATEPGTIDRLMVMLPALTGCRIGEVLGATWQHIDLKSGVFHVRLNLADSDKGAPPLLQPPKTKSSRRNISLPVELVHELKVWKLKCPQSEMQVGDTTVNRVFAREDGIPYHRNQASDALDRAITNAGLTKRPHQTGSGIRSQVCSWQTVRDVIRRKWL
jgi:integrase